MEDGLQAVLRLQWRCLCGLKARDLDRKALAWRSGPCADPVWPLRRAAAAGRHPGLSPGDGHWSADSKVGKTLYAFWGGPQLAQALDEADAGRYSPDPAIINCRLAGILRRGRPQKALELSGDPAPASSRKRTARPTGAQLLTPSRARGLLARFAIDRSIGQGRRTSRPSTATAMIFQPAASDRGGVGLLPSHSRRPSVHQERLSPNGCGLLDFRAMWR